MARPRKIIDPKQVEALAQIQCSYDEMGAVLGCSPDTLERRFAGVVKAGRASGRASLKRRQYKLAMDGNATMLIWLGKQLLGQQDKQAVEHSGPDGGPIEVSTDELRRRLAGRVAGIAARIGSNGDHPGTNGNGAGGH